MWQRLKQKQRAIQYKYLELNKTALAKVGSKQMKYNPDSSINLRPTGAHCRRIALQCVILGIREPLEERVSNRREARDLMYELRGRIKRRARKTPTAPVYTVTLQVSTNVGQKSPEFIKTLHERIQSRHYVFVAAKYFK